MVICGPNVNYSSRRYLKEGSPNGSETGATMCGKVIGMRLHDTAESGREGLEQVLRCSHNDPRHPPSVPVHQAVESGQRLRHYGLAGCAAPEKSMAR